MKKLTPKQEKFAQLAVTLGNQSEAYRQAYDVSETTSNEVIHNEASKLMSNREVTVRVEQLRTETKKAHKIDRQWIIDQHQEIIDWYKELKTLARKKDLSKDDKARVYMLKDLIKGADYRGSLDSITKMLGLNEPDKHEVKDTSHTTEWG